jgi:hypothetical protein
MADSEPPTSREDLEMSDEQKREAPSALGYVDEQGYLVALVVGGLDFSAITPTYASNPLLGMEMVIHQENKSTGPSSCYIEPDPSLVTFIVGGDDNQEPAGRRKNWRWKCRAWEKRDHE